MNRFENVYVRLFNGLNRKPQRTVYQKPDGSYLDTGKLYNYSIDQYYDHVAGRHTAACTLGLLDQTASICLDYDSGGDAVLLDALARLNERGIVAHAFSMPGVGSQHSGGHVWIVFDELVPIGRVRCLAGIVPNARPDFFPTGNGVRLPFGYHRGKKTWGSMIDQRGQRYDLSDAEQKAAAMEVFGQIAPLNRAADLDQLCCGLTTKHRPQRNDTPTLSSIAIDAPAWLDDQDMIARGLHLSRSARFFGFCRERVQFRRAWQGHGDYVNGDPICKMEGGGDTSTSAILAILIRQGLSFCRRGGDGPGHGAWTLHDMRCIAMAWAERIWQKENHEKWRDVQTRIDREIAITLELIGASYNPAEHDESLAKPRPVSTYKKGTAVSRFIAKMDAITSRGTWASFVGRADAADALGVTVDMLQHMRKLGVIDSRGQYGAYQIRVSDHAESIESTRIVRETQGGNIGVINTCGSGCFCEDAPASVDVPQPEATNGGLQAVNDPLSPVLAAGEPEGMDEEAWAGLLDTTPECVSYLNAGPCSDHDAASKPLFDQASAIWNALRQGFDVATGALETKQRITLKRFLAALVAADVDVPVETGEALYDALRQGENPFVVERQRVKAMSDRDLAGRLAVMTRYRDRFANSNRLSKYYATLSDIASQEWTRRGAGRTRMAKTNTGRKPVLITQPFVRPRKVEAPKEPFTPTPTRPASERTTSAINLTDAELVALLASPLSPLERYRLEQQHD